MGPAVTAIPTPPRASRALRALRESNSGLVVLALAVGGVAGAGAVAFRWLIRTFTLLLSGHADYSAAGHAANPHLPWLGRFFVLLAPVVAGLLYGPLVHRFAREARGHGVPEVMYAVARRGGKIAPQVAVVKALASALCIGGGGSVGREGPIVQIGSAFGSTLATWLRVDEERVRTLVACGAAGGIAATFNAPLAGVFFAMELILRDFAARAFGMVVLSSVTASVIGRAAFGNHPFLALPPFQVQHLAQYALFALLGLAAGVVGAAFTRVLYRVEDACDWAWRWPEWARPAVGGLLLGALLLVLPQMYGVGYPVLEHAVLGGYGIAFLIALLAGKMLATSLTIGIGGSGGVFAPSLFLGAMLGAAFGQAAHTVLPGIAGAPGAYAMVGMGAVFAGAARAPITAVVILFELTGEYSIILPLMAAIVLATGVSHLLGKETVYTAKLHRRGVDLDAPVSLIAALRVDQAIEPTPRQLHEDLPLQDAADLLARSPHGALPVVAADGRYLGTASTRAIAEELADGTPPTTPVGKASHLPHAITVDGTLADALALLAAADVQALPVLDADRSHLIGWISHQSILAAIHPATRHDTAVRRPMLPGAKATANTPTASHLPNDGPRRWRHS